MRELTDGERCGGVRQRIGRKSITFSSCSPLGLLAQTLDLLLLTIQLISNHETFL